MLVNRNAATSRSAQLDSNSSSLLVPTAERGGGDQVEPSTLSLAGENASWEESDPNLTAHFVRAVADLAARSVHLLDPFRLRSRHSVRRHPPSLTYDADNRAEFEMNIHSNLNRITHFVQVPLCFSVLVL